jgi:hypothetical protein
MQRAHLSLCLNNTSACTIILWPSQLTVLSPLTFLLLPRHFHFLFIITPLPPHFFLPPSPPLLSFLSLSFHFPEGWVLMIYILKLFLCKFQYYGKFMDLIELFKI